MGAQHQIHVALRARPAGEHADVAAIPGLSVATVLSTLVVPVFYVVMKNLVGKAGPSAGAA